MTIALLVGVVTPIAMLAIMCLAAKLGQLQARDVDTDYGALLREADDFIDRF